MTVLHEAQLLLAKMSRAKKAALLQEDVQDLDDAFSGIESRAGVCGGEACIARIRIPFWILHRLCQSGVSDAEILSSYPTLTAEDLTYAWHYARSHGDEIELQARSNEEA